MEGQCHTTISMDWDHFISPAHPIRQVKVKVEEILLRLERLLEKIQAQEGPLAIQPGQVLKARVLQALYGLDDARLFCLRVETDFLFRWFLDLGLNKSGFEPALLERCQELIFKNPEMDLFFSEMAHLVDSQGWARDPRFQVDRAILEQWAVMKGYRPKFYTPSKITIYLLIFLLLGSCYYWLCAREVGNVWGITNLFLHDRYGPYGDLTAAFLQGQVSLLVPPDPKLALSSDPYDPDKRLPGTEIAWDYSYYHGKYYLYFGPVPALILGCTWYYLTGGLPSLNLEVFICSILNLIFFFCFVRSLITQYFNRVPLGMECLIYILYGFSNLIPYVAGRSYMYELPIICASAFTLGFFVSILQSLRQNSRRWLWLFLASCSAGLAAGSRPTTAFLFIILGLYWLFLHRKPRLSTAFFKESLAVFLPAFLSVGAILWYNYARFQNPLSFGVEQILNNGGAHLNRLFQLKNIPEGLLAYYFLPWTYDPTIFPYIKMTIMTCFPNRGEDIVTGLLPSFPLDILALLWPFYIRKYPAPERNSLTIIGILISIWAVLLAMLVSAYFALGERYALELQLPVLLLTTVTLLARRHLGPLPTWQRYALGLLFIYGCYMGIIYGLVSEDFWIQDIIVRYRHAHGI